MAASSPNEPVESSCLEFLKDDNNEEDLTAELSSHPCEELRTLSTRVQKLEDKEASQQLEVQELKSQMEVLKQDQEKMTTVEVEVEEARSYARAMSAEREAIARERDEALMKTAVKEERLRQVGLALARAEIERNAIEKDYQEKVETLRRSHNIQNDKLRLWEEEINQVRTENAELKRENNFLRATFFEVNPNIKDRQRLKCFSCSQSYSVESPSTEACTFHPLPPVPPSVWQRWKHGHLYNYRRSEHRQCYYWSCCNTLSASGRRPEGCRRGPHHQRWEMDVQMKRVMLSRENVLNENDELQDPTIF
ncbi:protein enabled homolog [Patiria miniata]|uniref:Uncharacterized protein n=1 Tax=Patiria miniata TaxID=46514 RepID=A0A913ZCU7_PATMI|nr:protein enabled homolog [Patiria miniata]